MTAGGEFSGIRTSKQAYVVLLSISTCIRISSDTVWLWQLLLRVRVNSFDRPAFFFNCPPSMDTPISAYNRLISP